MQQPIVNLPFEVIEQIVAHLDYTDLMECIYVSLPWNITFRPLRYQSVKLTGKYEFDKFFKTLEDSVKPLIQPQRTSKRRKTNSSYSVATLPRVHNLGYYVRHLLVHDGVLTTKHMDKLASHCTRVRSITFRWDVNAADTFDHKPNTRKFMTPINFFNHFHPASLKSLTLGANTQPRDGIDEVYNLENTILPVLQQLPSIEALKLLYTGLNLHIRDIELIHKSCPQLNRLEIRHAFLRDDGLLARYARQLEEEMMGSDNDDDDVRWDISYENQLDTIIPATRLRSLALPSFIWSLGGGIWLAYILKKYPGLRFLDISCSEFYSSVAYFDREIPCFVKAWRDYFPQLSQVMMGRFSGKPSTHWPHLFSGINDIILSDDPTLEFEQFASTTSATDIHLLGLCIIPRSIHAIHHFKNLSAFYMGFRLPLKNYYQELPIETVLSSCPALKQMMIKNTIISYCNGNDDTTTSTKVVKSPLRDLKLKNVTFKDPNVLTLIGDQCPNLTSMELLFCTWLVEYKWDNDGSKYYPVIRIIMPHQRFMSFSLFYPRIGSSDLISISPLLLDMHEINEHSNQQPRKRVRHADGDNDYLLIKLPPKEEKFKHYNNKLYMTRLNSVKQKQNMSNVMTWLEQVDDDEEIYHSRSSNSLKILNDGIQNIDERLKGWSTVLSCNRIDHFYYGEVQLDLNNNDYFREHCRNLSLINSYLAHEELL